MIYVYVYAFSVRSVPGARQQVNALRFSGQAVEGPGARGAALAMHFAARRTFGFRHLGFWVLVLGLRFGFIPL